MSRIPSPSGARFALSAGEKAVLIAALAAAGVALGLLLPWLGGIAARFPIPFGDPIEKLSAFDSPMIVALRPLIGAVIGGIAGLLLAATTSDVTITRDRIVIAKGDESRVVTRKEVAGVHRNRRNVVVESHSGRRLFEGQIEGQKDEVAAAFVEHGYPWEMAR